MEKQYSRYGPTLLRLALGVMFLIAGYGKIKGPNNIVGMLTNMGFFAPMFFAWVLILSEIIFGLTVLIGWKVKYTVWPLVIILAVAIIKAVIPNLAQPGGSINLLFHLLGIAALISLALTGPGEIAVSKE